MTPAELKELYTRKAAAMTRRPAFARGSGEARVLLLDVPLGALDAFTRAHPNRHIEVRSGSSLRSLRLEVFDFGNVEKNREFDDMVREMARRLSRLMRRGDRGQ